MSPPVDNIAQKQHRDWSFGLTLEQRAEAIAALHPKLRVRLLELLRERFCLACGEDFSTDGVCYCTRDD